MSAAEDYPTLAGNPDGDRALAEIDLLRRDVSVLLSKLASAELKMRIAADPNASLWMRTAVSGSETLFCPVCGRETGLSGGVVVCDNCDWAQDDWEPPVIQKPEVW